MSGYRIKVIEYDRLIIAKVANGTVISKCSSAQSNEEAHECCVLATSEQGLKGYATNVLKFWTITLWSNGLDPLYNTSVNNKAAQIVALQAGFRTYFKD